MFSFVFLFLKEPNTGSFLFIPFILTVILTTTDRTIVTFSTHARDFCDSNALSFFFFSGKFS